MVLKYVKSFDGTRIHIDIKKSRNSGLPTLTFIHGLSLNKKVWNYEIDYFRKKGYPTVALDLRGHGMSDKPDSLDKYAIPILCKDIQAVIASEKLDNTLIIGHSLGGLVAIHTAADTQAVKGIVAISTLAKIPNYAKKVQFLSGTAIKLLHFIAEHEHIRKEHFPEFDMDLYLETKEKGAWSNIIRIIHNAPLKSIVSCFDSYFEGAMLKVSKEKKILAQIKVPSLVICPTQDILTSIEDAKFIASHIDKAVLYRIDAHHNVLFEKPETLSEVIEEFIKEHCLDNI